MTRATFDPDAILARLVGRRVRFVLIGGYACQFHGVGNVTLDLDIVIEPSRENAEALVAALEDMGAIHAPLPGSHQRIPPSVERVMGLRGFHHYDTRFGRLDVSKTTGDYDYGALTTEAQPVMEGGHQYFIAELRTLARMKTAAGREKDKRVLPAIHRRLEELSREND